MISAKMTFGKFTLSVALLALSFSAFAEDAPDSTPNPNSNLGQMAEPACENEYGSTSKVLESVPMMNVPALKSTTGDKSAVAK